MIKMKMALTQTNTEEPIVMTKMEPPMSVPLKRGTTVSILTVLVTMTLIKMEMVNNHSNFSAQIAMM